MLVNRKIFYEGFRKAFGKLTQENVDDLNFILNKLDNSSMISGSDWDIVKAKYAYIFATIYWETAQTFDPISEKGSRRYLMAKPYYPYYGRGFGQLTWRENYRIFGLCIGVDLVNNPYLANEPENAWKILEEGMTRSGGPGRDANFTGLTLNEVFDNGWEDEIELVKLMVKARRIINGTDKANTIADIAMKFFSFIELTDEPQSDIAFEENENNIPGAN